MIIFQASKYFMFNTELHMLKTENGNFFKTIHTDTHSYFMCQFIYIFIIILVARHENFFAETQKSKEVRNRGPFAQLLC